MTLECWSLFKTRGYSIRAAHARKRYIPGETTAELDVHVTDDVLSPRELEALKRVALGNPNRSVALLLSLIEDTMQDAYEVDHEQA